MPPSEPIGLVLRDPRYGFNMLAGLLIMLNLEGSQLFSKHLVLARRGL